MPTNRMMRFTQRARRVLSLAHEEAERLWHNYIGTEHLLLGLMREEGGIAGRVLRDLGVEQRRVEELVEELSHATTRETNQALDLSPGTKRVLEMAVDEARRMGHHYIGTEHLLLALVRQSEGVAMEVLDRFGVKGEDVRRQTRRVLQESPIQGQPPPAKIETPDKPPARIRMTKNRMLRVAVIDTVTGATKFEVKFTPEQVQNLLDLVYVVFEREDTSGIVLDDKDRSQRIEVFIEDDVPPTAESGIEDPP